MLLQVDVMWPQFGLMSSPSVSVSVCVRSQCTMGGQCFTTALSALIIKGAGWGFARPGPAGGSVGVCVSQELLLLLLLSLSPSFDSFQEIITRSADNSMNKSHEENKSQPDEGR